MKKGKIITTRHGKGRIKGINISYSVPLYLIELTEGRFKGESLAIVESEIEEVRE